MTEEIRCKCGRLLAKKGDGAVTMKRAGVRVHFGVMEWDCEKCGRKTVLNTFEGSPVHPLWMNKAAAGT